MKNLIILCLLFGIASCGQKQGSTVKQLDPQSAARVTSENAALTFNLNGVEVVDEIDPRYKFVYRSTIKAPISTESVYNGIVQATGVSLFDSDKKMVISYNTKDNVVEGGFDIVDISNLSAPVVLKSTILPKMEFADSKIVNDKLYLTGVDEDNGAVLLTISIANIAAPVVLNKKVLASYYATSLDIQGNNLLVTTGDLNGFVYSFTLDAAGIPVQTSQAAYNNLLYVKNYDNGYVVLFDDTDGLTYLGVKNNTLNTFKKILVNGTHLFSPARFDLDDDIAFVATADSKTVEIIDLSTMTKVNSIALAGRGNGLKFQSGLLYVAQGIDGFRFFDVQNIESPQNLGKYDFLDSGAGNNVWTFDLSTKRVVVLADGLGGVKILSQEKLLSGSPICKYATKVIQYNPKGTIDPLRKDSSKTLGSQQGPINSIINFASLGVGGSIVLEFSPAIKNTPNKKDFNIHEITWNNQTFSQYPEQAEVYASNNLCSWTYIGLAKNANGNPTLNEFDLGSLKSAKYIKLIDKTTMNGDGFDLDAISCLNQGTTAISGTDYGILLKDGNKRKVYQLFINEASKSVETYSIFDTLEPASHIGITNNGVNLIEVKADGKKVHMFDLPTKQFVMTKNIASHVSLTQVAVMPNGDVIVGNSNDDNLYKLPISFSGFSKIGKVYTHECGYVNIAGADLTYVNGQLYLATNDKGGLIYKVTWDSSRNRYQGTLMFKNLGKMTGLAAYKDSKDSNKVKFLVSIANSSYMKLVYDSKVIKLNYAGELLRHGSNGDLAVRNY